MCILFFFPVLLVSFGQRRLSYWLSLVLFVQKIRSLFSTREGLHHRRLDLGVLSVSRIQSSLVFWGLRDLILFGHTRLPCFSGHFVWVLQERVFILFPSFWSLSLLNSCLFFTSAWESCTLFQHSIREWEAGRNIPLINLYLCLPKVITACFAESSICSSRWRQLKD